METAKKPILELIKVKPDLKYKLVVPLEVEKKIRLLCSHISEVEWSGILFYKYEGAFDDKDNPLVITCLDIYQMDKGSAAYTEYNMSPDVVSYMVDHAELLGPDVFQGLIHSHNKMATFFSGTDTATLREEGQDMAHFVSLIVNNAGKYSAAITRRHKAVQLVKEKFEYPTWGDREISGVDEYETQDEYIEYFPLEVEVETVPINDSEAEMLARMKEIDTKKASTVRTTSFYGTPQYGASYQGKYPGLQTIPANTPSTYVPIGQYGKKDSDERIFAKDTKKNWQEAELPFGISEDMPYGTVVADAKIIDWLVKQVVTASIIIPSDNKIDVSKWIDSMHSLYSTRFKTMKEFEYFASSHIDFLINNTYDKSLSSLTEVDMQAIIAYDLSEALKELPSNVWIKSYIKFLNDYIL